MIVATVAWAGPGYQVFDSVVPMTYNESFTYSDGATPSGFTTTISGAAWGSFETFNVQGGAYCMNIQRIRSATHTHTGNNNSTTMTDASVDWNGKSLTGCRITNESDGYSGGTISSNSDNTVFVTLSGGVENLWDTGDIYSITQVTGTVVKALPYLTRDFTFQVEVWRGEASIETITVLALNNIASSQNGAHVVFWGDGKIMYHNGTGWQDSGQTWAPTTHYTIKAVVRPSSGEWDLYLGGSQIATDIPFRTSGCTSIDGVRFGSNSLGYESSTTYWDNIQSRAN